VTTKELNALLEVAESLESSTFAFYVNPRHLAGIATSFQAQVNKEIGEGNSIGGSNVAEAVLELSRLVGSLNTAAAKEEGEKKRMGRA